MRSLRLALLSLSAASTALASSGYPAVLQSHLTLSAQPACTVCHATAVGGAGTATTLFGTAVRANGAVGGEQDAKLTAALDKMNSANVDSDGDGVSDIAELKAGTDPNVKSGTTPTDTVPPIAYGCGANAVPELLGFGGLAALAGLFRRRR